MIDENKFAFGLDTEKWNSIPSQNKWMNWEEVALHKEPTVTFVICRAGISWGYQDDLFPFNWKGIASINAIRAQNGFEAYPIGRGAYHVLYPGEDPIRQADNLIGIVEVDADWDHDRLVLDLELDHEQDKRRITECAKRFAYKCHERTGRYPILYSRTSWLEAHTHPQELTFMELWGAQYRYPLPFQTYTPEHEPPLDPLPTGFQSWLIKQTAERGKPIGSPVKKVMDYNRWNGGPEIVAKYFGHDAVVEPPEPPNTIYIPLFSQHDSRWASDKLGTSSVTIGAYGCLVTIAAMICKHFGKDTDPGRLNKKLVEVNGYENHNLLNYNSITKIYPDIIVDWDLFLNNPSNQTLIGVLERGLPAIVQVDQVPETAVLDQHWVTIIGKDQHGFIIADPIDGEIAYLSRYNNKLFRLVVFEYRDTNIPNPPVPPVVVPPDALERLWAAHPELHNVV